MNSLIEKFERFQRGRYSQNPPGESPITAFVRHMAEEKELLTYGETDWLKLAEKLDLSDDQYGQLMEGVASWIPEEDTPPSRQEPADWPDEVPKGSGIPAAQNPSVRYGKGTEIEDCSCEETCDCDPCPCDECESCEYDLCCCQCSEGDDDDAEEEMEGLGDQDEGEEE
jgi:hypothetical protein